MALKILQPGVQPLGQFDAVDGQISSIMGGEVVTLGTVLVPSSDLAASDVFDGYVNADTARRRVVATRVLGSDNRPLFLADDGIAGYGTILGSVVGGTVGQVVNGATLGPSTITGSGKLTLWDKPGLYAVSLDGAADNTATPVGNPTGLIPANWGLTTGAPLYATVTGKLTPNVGIASLSNAIVGRFVDFATNGSLVTTPNYLVAAFGLPVSATNQYSFATFYFTPNV
jgi:hypothetical protein